MMNGAKVAGAKAQPISWFVYAALEGPLFHGSACHCSIWRAWGRVTGKLPMHQY
jgi:hypothetical protein